MPEFIMPMGDAQGERQFAELSPFVRGYIEAMFFTNSGDRDDPIPEGSGFTDLAPEALSAIEGECFRFEHEAASAILGQAYQRGYEPEQAGRDFWYTRNGHGVGFWDREVLEEDGMGEELSKSAHSFGMSDVYEGDDGLLYVS